MIKKLSLNTRGVSSRDAERLYAAFGLLMGVYVIITKVTVVRALENCTGLMDIIMAETKGRFEFENYSDQVGIDLSNAMDLSHRMASSIRCSSAVNLLTLTCRWFDRQGRVLGDIQFTAGLDRDVVVHFIPGHLAKYINGV